MSNHVEELFVALGVIVGLFYLIIVAVECACRHDEKRVEKNDTEGNISTISHLNKLLP